MISMGSSIQCGIEITLEFIFFENSCVGVKQKKDVEKGKGVETHEDGKIQRQRWFIK